MTDAIIPLPRINPQFDMSAIDRANLQPSTREKYKKAISVYLATGGTLTDRRALAEYALDLSSSGRAFLKAAIKLICRDLASDMKAQANPQNLQVVQASLLRLDALTDVVQTDKQPGSKAHLWLSSNQVRALLETCDLTTLAGRRDWMVLAILVGAGLRREGMASLTFEQVKTLPLQDGYRTVLEVTEKGSKQRVIPIADRLAERLENWKTETGGGRVARGFLGRTGELGKSLSTVGIFNLVREHGAAIGCPGLAPHDLRRTYAQLGYEAGIPLTQISRLLGHASVATTQKYLDLELNLSETISDFIPL